MGGVQTAAGERTEREPPNPGEGRLQRNSRGSRLIAVHSDAVVGSAGVTSRAIMAAFHAGTRGGVVTSRLSAAAALQCLQNLLAYPRHAAARA